MNTVTKEIKETLEKIKQTIRFWWWILREAIISSILFSELRGGITDILKGLAINLLSLLGIGAFRGFDFTDIIYWLVILLIVRFFWFLVYLPSKFYSRKRMEANRLTWADIDIKEFTFPKQSGFGVGLEVISKKHERDFIMNVQAEINNIRRLGISSNNSFKARLAWAIGARSIFTLLWDGTVVYPNDPRILLIANSDGEKGWIETQDSDRQLSPISLDNNVHYQFSHDRKITFRFCGTVCAG